VALCDCHRIPFSHFLSLSCVNKTRAAYVCVVVHACMYYTILVSTMNINALWPLVAAAFDVSFLLILTGL
jgi:hypothetical protein